MRLLWCRGKELSQSIALNVVILAACGEMIDSANVVTGSNFRARKYNKPRDRSSRNFVLVTIFARHRTSDTGC